MEAESKWQFPPKIMGRHSLSLCFFEEKDLRMFEMGNVLILSNIWIKTKVAPSTFQLPIFVQKKT